MKILIIDDNEEDRKNVGNFIREIVSDKYKGECIVIDDHQELTKENLEKLQIEINKIISEMDTIANCEEIKTLNIGGITVKDFIVLVEKSEYCEDDLKCMFKIIHEGIIKDFYYGFDQQTVEGFEEYSLNNFIPEDFYSDCENVYSLVHNNTKEHIVSYLKQCGFIEEQILFVGDDEYAMDVLEKYAAENNLNFPEE